MSMNNVRVLEVISESGKAHALISALIDTLPPPGTDWPSEQRAAWLHMMETAFIMVYGAVGAVAMRAAPTETSKPAAAAPKPTAPAPAFYIDAQGHARGADGEPVLPGEVNDAIFDQRGEHGDLGAIVWADGSRGVAGLQLDIRATF